MKLFLSFAFTFITVFSVQAKKYDMQLNLNQGEVYVQNMNSEMTISQSFGGNEVNITMVVDGAIEYKVLSDANNVYDVEVKYTRLGIKMDMPQMKMDYSSGQDVSDSVNNMMSLMFDNMVGESFSMKLTKKGLVKEVTGMEEVFIKMFEGLPSVSEEQKTQLGDQIKSAFGEDSFKKSMEMATAIFPEGSVKPGASWVKSTTMETTLSFNMETTYTLSEVTDEYYIITSVSDLTTVGEGEYQEKNGMLMKQEMKGTATAEIKLDKNSGWVVLSKTTQKITGNSYMKESADGEEMAIPMSIIAVTTLTDKK